MCRLRKYTLVLVAFNENPAFISVNFDTFYQLLYNEVQKTVGTSIEPTLGVHCDPVQLGALLI